ncbi:MAG: uroporphyrinogen-III synthase, partial [Flavobacteriales bacterium]|nr:uroporphyrinogen-III synthase [Flavobacteriales bacterium]
MMLKVKSILVSQPKPETVKSPYFDLSEQCKVKIDFREFIHIEGVSAKEFRQQKINLADFDSVILTSKNAVDHFF